MDQAQVGQGVNPVLAFALEHQADAKRLLLWKGMPLDDVDDVVQDALVKVLSAVPTPAMPAPPR